MVKVPTFEKSVANIEEWMKEWDYEKNDIEPHLVFASGQRMCWWICKECSHSYQMYPNAKKGTRCPECIRLDIYNNSVAIQRPDLALHWHPTKNKKTAFEYKVRSNIKVWWLGKCGHEWESIITNRSRNKNSKCPNCNGRVLNEHNNLAIKHPKIAQQWNYEKNGNVTPRDVFAVGHQKYWWKCKYGHEWEAMIANRTRGRGCPECNSLNFTSYSEQALFYYVQKIFPDAINTHKEDYEYVIGGSVELDIFIPSQKIAIEYDGVWYHNNKRREVNDINKNNMCLFKDYHMIRLRETGLKETLFSNDVLNCDPHKKNLNEKIREVLEVISSIVEDEHIEEMIKNIEINHEDVSDEIYESLNRVREFDNVSITHPYLVEYWSSKNTLSMSSLTYGSNFIVLWECKECGEEWKSSVTGMTDRKTYRICINCHKNNNLSLAYKLPEVAKLWHPTKNGELTPHDVKPNSRECVYWIDQNGIETYCMVKSKKDYIKQKEKRKQRKLKQETGK